MQLTIHRGTKEIGGSCVEIATETTKIIIDVGLPLVDQEREPFDRNSMRGKSVDKLVSNKIVPAVPGLFTECASKPDAILLSHAHLDHVGLLAHTPSEVPVFATAGTSKMMLAGAVLLVKSPCLGNAIELLKTENHFPLETFELRHSLSTTRATEGWPSWRKPMARNCCTPAIFVGMVESQACSIL